MPLYEYRCESCGDVFEIIHKISEAAPTKCEKCGKGPMERLLSKSSFALKGNGWYVTDFKGGTPPKPSSGGGSEGGSGGGGGSSGS